MSITLQVNGESRTFDGDPAMPLLWFLRDELGLIGTKFGCGIAACGACTVHVDGQSLQSCVTPMSGVSGKKITTIEGLDPRGEHPVQVAWREHNTPQCGYCQSGQIMRAAALLRENPNPTREQIVEYMSPNICRCGTYYRIVRAIERAAKEVA
jgi:isoquinoline 1-oxidoreductase alpha subunit